MSSLLLSGPAGANKTALARQLLTQAARLTVAADFQSIYTVLVLAVRGPDGRFPLRNNQLLPLTEYVRRAIITGATGRGIDVIATNSDGAADRRNFLLQELGPDAAEQILDPGADVVTGRLSDPITGEVSSQCRSAIARWYDHFGGPL